MTTARKQLSPKAEAFWEDFEREFKTSLSHLAETSEGMTGPQRLAWWEYLTAVETGVIPPLDPWTAERLGHTPAQVAWFAEQRSLWEVRQRKETKRKKKKPAP